MATSLLTISTNHTFAQSTDQNTFLGYKAGLSSTSVRNTYIGYEAGLTNTGQGNTMIGSQAGGNSGLGSFNVFIGLNAGYNNTSGGSNMFLGQRAGIGNTTGSYNSFIGNSSGENNTIGDNNNFIGNAAGFSNTTGKWNVYVGSAAGASNVSGENNVSVGMYAGQYSQYGGNNTFIGFNSGSPQNVSLSNASAFGANATVTASNALILGNGANVGIGNTAPTAKLHITTGSSNTSGLRLENLTINSPASVTGQYKFLTVDASGNVILGSSTGYARLAADNWTTNGDQLQNTNEGAVIVGQGIDRVPVGYNLIVSKGILTERVKVAVKTTDDWSDKVFESGYSMKGLRELEEYIHVNKHLPGIPSASDVVKQGIDVATMDAKLLEKIEELTLYSIQLEKTNRKQQKEIDELKSLVRQIIENK